MSDKANMQQVELPSNNIQQIIRQIFNFDRVSSI